MIGLFVFGDGLVNNILRKIVVAVRVCLEIVADKLIVKGRLAMAGLIALQRPETAAVRGEHFVCQNDVAVLVKTELKLGVSNDDTLSKGIVGAFLVKCQRAVAEFLSILLAFAREFLLQDINALLIADVFVVGSASFLPLNTNSKYLSTINNTIGTVYTKPVSCEIAHNE